MRVISKRSEVGDQRSEIRSRKSEVRDQRLEIGYQTSEVGDQRSRGWRSDSALTSIINFQEKSKCGELMIASLLGYFYCFSIQKSNS